MTPNCEWTLVIERSDTGERSNPAGRLENRETIMRAAFRELKEEAGLSPNTVSFLLPQDIFAVHDPITGKFSVGVLISATIPDSMIGYKAVPNDPDGETSLCHLVPTSQIVQQFKSPIYSQELEASSTPMIAMLRDRSGAYTGTFAHRLEIVTTAAIDFAHGINRSDNIHPQSRLPIIHQRISL